VFVGYKPGTLSAGEIAHYNAILETTVGNINTMAYIQLHTVEPEELSRIRYELDRPDTVKVHRFDYTLYGDIAKNGDEYVVRTRLVNNKSTRVIPPSYYSGKAAAADLEAVVRQHGREVVEALRMLKTPITLDSIIELEKSELYETALQWLNYYEIQQSTNATELAKALPIEKRIQEKIGGTPSALPDIFYVPDQLSKADYAIDRALQHRSLKRNEREDLYRESKRLLDTAERADTDAAYRNESTKIREKIAEYERRHLNDLYTGGIEAAFFDPLVFMNLMDDDILDYYPNICGVLLNWIIPADDANMQFYLTLDYLGFMNQAVQKAEYLDEALLYRITLTGGLRYQWQLWKTVFPYIFLGIGYSHVIEYVQDSEGSAAANFSSLLLESGAGTRIHITPNIALFGNIGLDLNLGLPLAFSVQYSAGVSWLFYGKTNSYSY
jgi:hypothetical protein